MTTVTKERFEKEVKNENAAKKLLEVYKEARQLAKEVKKIKMQKAPLTLKMRFSNILFNISISLFMWGMRIEKRKIPLYWTGPDFKQYKYSVWLLILAGWLSIKMKYRGRAACVIFDSGRKISVAQCDLQLSQEMNALYYQKVCEAGARIYKKMAKEYNQKTFELKEINNADTNAYRK